MTALEAESKSYTFDMSNLAANDEVYFTFKDWRGETWSTTAIGEGDLTDDSVQQALEALPNAAIPSVSVSSSADVYTVTFNDAGSNSGSGPELAVVTASCTTAGCQPYSAGTTATVTTSVAASGHADDSTSKSLPCSNRGVCDGETGTCECFEGFYGQTCESQTIIT